MEKEQYRSVIRFLFLDGKTCEEIKTKLDAVYGNPSPSITTVRYWFNWLGGKRFTSNEEVIAETEAYFAEFDKSYFSEGLKKWQKRWEKCILLKEDYVEK
ncbi:hypothetical protein ALC60_00953 [Trachymyrmex zeteki]|uniref:Mos1 transposase HTH domain-containing protein n=1 Tax=Mycetomoellerius zeteki TaxID=64791 RepID=A0A151XHV0_9HYME|nr:hypothetical protein ALC60_00953 [Trachymyrmex zeteki]